MSKVRRNENGNHRNARSSQKSVCAFATFAAEAIQIRPQTHPKFHQYGPRADSLENRGNKSVFAERLGLPRSQNENSTARTRKHLLYHSPDAAIAVAPYFFKINIVAWTSAGGKWGPQHLPLCRTH